MSRCSQPGCYSMRDLSPRAWGENEGLCARHRQADRVRRGVCLNCGGPLNSRKEMNALTGRPLVRDGEEVLVLRCVGECGYTRRTRPRRRSVGAL